MIKGSDECGRFLTLFKGTQVQATLFRGENGRLSLLDERGEAVPTPIPVIGFKIRLTQQEFIRESFLDGHPAHLAVSNTAASLDWQSMWPFDSNAIPLNAELEDRALNWLVHWHPKASKRTYFNTIQLTKLSNNWQDITPAWFFLDPSTPDIRAGVEWQSKDATKIWQFLSKESITSNAIVSTFQGFFGESSVLGHGLTNCLIGYCGSDAIFAPIGKVMRGWKGAVPLRGIAPFGASGYNESAPDFFVAPLLFFRRIAADVADLRDAPWRAVIQAWLPENKEGQPRPGFGQKGMEVIKQLWTQACSGRATRGLALPGTPWTFLPSFEFNSTSDDDFSTSIEWLLSFSTHEKKWIAHLDYARLIRRQGTSPSGQSATLTFLMKDVNGEDAALKLAVKIAAEKVTESDWSPPSLNLKIPDSPAKVIDSVTSASAESGLVEARFDVVSVTSAPKNPIRLGSLEVRFHEGAARNGRVVLRLRGEWTSSKEAKFAPEVDLKGLPCTVNPMAGQDASSAENTVVLDGDDSDEFIRRGFVEGDGFSLGPPDSLQDMEISIREKHAIDRNPVTSFELRRQEGTDGVSRHLSLQIRPFAIAAIERQDFSEQSGDLIAIWRSDDAQGAQWRWGVDEITLSLPPSVSEEIERGVRFWPDSKPYIDPTSPVRYRFTTPAVVSVVPGVQTRRYNRSAQNLDWILADAEVTQFRAEIMYPVVARFRRDKEGMPRIRVREAAGRFGTIAEPLPLISSDPFGPRLRAFDMSTVNKKYTVLRVRHSVSAYNYRSRLAQYELYDHFKPNGLSLDRGLEFTIRKSSRRSDASAPSLDPLPLTFQPAAAPEKWEWVDPKKNNGGIRTGVIHTIEFPSELEAVLRKPTSEQGTIDTLAFTPLGASGTSTVAFDEGRTHFTVTMQDGQAHRIVKTRIGRIGVLWNRAKHVIVYERSVLPSEQFDEEQTESGEAHPFDGWPIIRKTEEYVELLQPLRRFVEEAEADGENQAGSIDGSEFFSKRMAVNGAWGRDLGTGYEIPLWNANSDPGIYPKPDIALRGQIDRSAFVNLRLRDPSQLTFYTNTEKGTGSDSDKWAAMQLVDFLNLARPGRSSADLKLTANDVLKPRLAAASPFSLGWDRFNFWVEGDAIDIVAGRSETPVYVRPERILLMRSAQLAAVESAPAGDLQRAEQLLATVSPIRPQDPAALPAGIADSVSGFRIGIETELKRLLGQFGRGVSCDSLRSSLKQTVKQKHDEALNEVRSRLKEASDSVEKIGQDVSGIDAEARRLVASLRLTLLQPYDSIELARRDIRMEFAAALEYIEQGKDPENVKKKLLRMQEFAVSEQERMFHALSHSLSQTAMDDLNKWIVQWKTNLTTAGDAIKEGLSGTVEVRSKFVIAKKELEKQLVTLPDAIRGKVGESLPAGVNVLILDGLKASINLTNASLSCCDQVSGHLIVVGEVAQYLKSAVDSLSDKVMKATTLVAEIATSMSDFTINVIGKANTLLVAMLDAVNASDTVRIKELLRNVIDATDWTAGWLSGRKEIYEEIVNSCISSLTIVVSKVLGGLLSGSQISRIAITQSRDVTEKVLARTREELDKAIDAIAKDCVNAEQIIREQLNAAEGRLNTEIANTQERFGSALNDAIESELGKKIRQDISSTQQIIDKGSKLVKLAKLVGSPPELPTLRFNRDRIEYVFSDMEKQVLTSPMAARLREIDGALNELGLNVPTRSILEQLIPDQLGGIDIQKVFKDLAGLRFDNLFPGMRLPSLDSNKIKITHGVDVRARTAWVTAAVDVPFTEEITAFGGPVPLRIANARFTAEVKVETSQGGTQSRSFGRVKGDWSLTLGSERLATFRDVSILFSSDKGLEFDISMDRVQLHPTVQFVSEYAKNFEKKLPPGVEIIKRDGMPVGVKSSIANTMPGFNLGFVAVGPFVLSSGFSLLLKSDGAPQGVMISTNVGVGSRKLPFLMQIGWLTGAAWLEANATLRENGSLEPSASIGFAAGTGRSVTVAGVAHASYSFLFFVNGSATSTSSVFDAGIRIAGEARLLGFLSASILLELIARQQSGKMKGYGTLDVEVDICWNYSVHVVRTVEQDV